MNQIPNFRQQAAKMLDIGSCDLPLNFQDVANHVAKHPNFAHALRNVMEGDTRLMQMMTITAANQLCKDFDNEL